MAADPPAYKVKAIRAFPLTQAEWGRVAEALGLPPQQARIVRLLLHGYQDKQIAAELGLGLPTVRTYMARIFARLGVDDRLGLVLHVFGVSHRIHRCRGAGCHRDR